MGTHPIFESDFDCLTEKVNNRSKNMLGIAYIVRDAIPNYLRSVPIPYNFGDLGDMSLGEWAHFVTFASVSGFAGHALYQKCMAKSTAGRCNQSVQLSDEKVVHAYDMEDLADKEVYWEVFFDRCLADINILFL